MRRIRQSIEQTPMEAEDEPSAIPNNVLKMRSSETPPTSFTTHGLKLFRDPFAGRGKTPTYDMESVESAKALARFPLSSEALAH